MARDGGKLDWSQRRFLALLALPSGALALAATMVSTYLPVLIGTGTSAVAIGLLIGAEGLVALFLPVMIGGWSDRLQTRWGGRLPFIAVATPVAAAAVVAMSAAGSLAPVVPLVLLFYLAYFTYYPPYRALYPDLVPDELRGRSQGAQKTLREVGLVAAVLAGGPLLTLWTPLPFALAAGILLAVSAAFVVRFRGRAQEASDAGRSQKPKTLRETYREQRALLRDARLRRLVLANTLWELALGAIKTFVVLFFVVGLGYSPSAASGALGVAAIAIVAAALIGGKLADRYGELRLVRIAVVVYGIGVVTPGISQEVWVLGAIIPVAFAAGIVVTLAFSMVMAVMPDAHHGAASGLFELSRGLGVLAGPALAGAAITLAEPLFSSTHGFAAMWFVAAGAVLASLPLLSRLGGARGTSRLLRPGHPRTT